MYLPPFLLIAIAGLCFLHARLAAGSEDRVVVAMARLIRAAAPACLAVALCLAARESLMSGCAIIGISGLEAERYRRRFERCLTACGMSMKEAAIAIYGSDDHGRLRREVDAGGVRDVLRERLGDRFQELWIDELSDERKLRVVGLWNVERTARIFSLQLKPVAMKEEDAACYASR